ncbi:hypothetical protein C4D60_Mb02t13410 [Musa balbisiana]|uniref:Uncharacterized protein n=1 Tax=Musa balbisiana TaxID=52838 RepID=A0A4S8IBR8_MUSBA|nr:hypothetical protein C4D60_Mb02t13410 [Musa balbisiana]
MWQPSHLTLATFNMSKTSSFIVEVPCEGTDGLCPGNHGTDTQTLVDSDINALQDKTSLDCKCDKIEYYVPFVEGPVREDLKYDMKAFEALGYILHQ